MENVQNMEKPVGSRVPRDRDETVGDDPRAPRDGWRKVRLGEIADCTLGKMLDHKKNHGTLRRYLANYNVRWGEFDLDDVSQMPFEDAELDKYRLQNGDLVVCEGGEIGRCALWRDEGEMFIQKALHRVRVHEHECNASYLYYWFLNSGRNDFFKQFTTGATILHLPRQNLIGIPVDLPPLPIQRRIAEILGAYDDAIENNRRRIALLEKMARELYRERFVRRAGKSCRRVVIGDICTRIGSGGTPSRKEVSYWEHGNIDWFKTKELFDDWLIDSEEKITQEGLDNSSAKIFAPNTIVMAIYASPTVGRLGVLSKEACTNQAALGLVADEKDVSWQWLFFLLQNKREYFNRIAAGAGQQNISAEVVKNCEFDLPEKSEIDAFTAVVAPLFEERLALALQNRNLARQRDRLLPRLMSGRLGVGA